MKSLDKTIKAFEVCQNGSCKDCPSAVMVGPDDYRCSEEHLTDAFQYLQEYKGLLTMWNQKLDELERTKKSCFEFVGSKMIEAEKQGRTFCCPNCGDEFILLPESNEALTWDELLGMKEKPVWAEYYDPIDDKSGWKRGQWVLVDQYDDDEIEFFPMGADYPDYIRKELYKPDGWQAYRRERS